MPMHNASRARLSLLMSLFTVVAAMAAPRPTIESSIEPPAGYVRFSVPGGSFAASLRTLELADPGPLLAGDGKTWLCEEEKVATTVITPYDNRRDTGVDGIVKLWGEYLWKNRSAKSISFPLDNGQIATWSDWKDGLRPRPSGGRIIFMQVTTPDGSYQNYQRFLAFVGEEMGALALRRESTILVDDSVSVGDLLVAVTKEGESRIGIILDACKIPGGERLFLLGTCGTPSTSLYIVRPYAPVQGVKEWFTLDGAKYAIGGNNRVDLRRVTLK